MKPVSHNLDSIPLRASHFRILFTASLGQLTGAGLSTLVGIVLPLIQLTLHPELSSYAQGLVGCTGLVGITVGSLLFGRLSDRYGYLLFFRLCPLIVLVASLGAFYAGSLPGLVAGLFFMGLGIGGEYSLDSDYISELMPRRYRLVMVGTAKATSSLGNILVALCCFLLLRRWHDPELWPRLLLLISALALLMLLLRLRFAQSPIWLLAQGCRQEAEEATRRLLGSDVVLLSAVQEGEKATSSPRPDAPVAPSEESLFRGKNLKRVIFSGIPWACEGLGVYGIGIFLPVLLISLGLESGAADASGATTEAVSVGHIVRSVELTTWINLFVLLGFVVGLCLVNRCRHVRMQVWGFLCCALGLALLLVAYAYHLPVWVSLAGFMLFELFLNAGPHLMTFILPAQIYPVAERGEGAGVAAAMGKVGAVVGVLFIPLLLEWGGIELVLWVTLIAQLTGALVTMWLGKEVLPDG